MLKDIIAKWTKEDRNEMIIICEDLYKKNNLDRIKPEKNDLLSLLKQNEISLKEYNFTPDEIYKAMTRQF